MQFVIAEEQVKDAAKFLAKKNKYLAHKGRGENSLRNPF